MAATCSTTGDALSVHGSNETWNFTVKGVIAFGLCARGDIFTCTLSSRLLLSFRGSNVADPAATHLLFHFLSITQEPSFT